MKHEPQLTVAMPLYKTAESDMTWLAMYGLANQKHPGCAWELIVCEEKGSVGCKDWYNKYFEQMKERGCVRILTLSPDDDWVIPSHKWYWMCRMAGPESKAIVIQDGDDLSYPERLAETYIAFNNGADWFDIRKCLFYHVRTGQYMMLNNREDDRTHACIAFSTKRARNLPFVDHTRYLNSWLYRYIKKQVGKDRFVHRLDEDLKASLDTHGCNQISNRDHFFNKPRHPFEDTSHTMKSVGISDGIIRAMEDYLTKS